MLKLNIIFLLQYLDFDNLPDTNFSCDGKVIGGYYADIETGCQMFHVCTIGQKCKFLFIFKKKNNDNNNKGNITKILQISIN